jgi:single-strand DNA-binding protein
VNLVVVRGRLSRPAVERVLASGDRLVNLEVTVPRPGGRADTVPVVWIDAPPAVALLDAGEEVLVVGRVRRRFFRAGGGTGSRTEVVADRAVPTRHARRAASALAAVVAVLEAS